MTTMTKLQRQAFAAIPVVMSVGSARLSHARLLQSPSGIAGLPVDRSYAGTDTLIIAAARQRGLGDGAPAVAGAAGLGPADSAAGWQGEQAAKTRRGGRPSAMAAACATTQETEQADGMTSAEFAGNGYPSWRTRT